MSVIKKNILIILIGFSLSCLLSIYSINKFDIYEISSDDEQRHSMIKGVNANHWYKAKDIKDQLSEGKSYFQTGDIYDRNYLPSRIFLIYSYLTGDQLVEDRPDSKIVTNKKKVIFLIFQSILYFSILFFFSLRLLNLFKPLTVLFVVGFLSLEPSLIQWHSSFWSESIFVSFQLLFFAILLKKNLRSKDLIFAGLILGLMFLQRSATIYYIFPILFLLFFLIDDYKLKKISFFLASYLIIILFVGYHNLKRAGVFYIAPTDQKLAIMIYMMPNIMSSVEDISIEESRVKINNQINNFKKKNNFQLSNEVDLIKYYKMIQNYSYNYIFRNPIETTKFVIKKSLHTAVLDPVHVSYFHKFEYKGKDRYLNSLEHQFWIPIRITYSILIYLIILVGFFSLLKSNKKIFLLTFLSTIYFFLILSWLGNPRYLTPCIVYLSLFFGFGMDRLLANFKQREYNSQK